MALPASPLLGKTQASAPAVYAEVVVPSDSTNFTYPARSLYVGVTGDLNLVMADGVAVLFKNVPVGIFPVTCSRVNSTSTTATFIVALV